MKDNFMKKEAGSVNDEVWPDHDCQLAFRSLL
jgi:hypothetical protein